MQLIKDQYKYWKTTLNNLYNYIIKGKRNENLTTVINLRSRQKQKYAWQLVTIQIYIILVTIVFAGAITTTIQQIIRGQPFQIAFAIILIDYLVKYYQNAGNETRLIQERIKKREKQNIKQRAKELEEKIK